MQVQGRTLHTTRTTLLAPKKSYIFGFSRQVSSFCIPISLSAETALGTLAPPSDTSHSLARHSPVPGSPVSAAATQP